MGPSGHRLDVTVYQAVIHEDVPKFQRGLDTPRLGGHRREPFQQGGCVASVCQGTYNGAVGICCDSMAKNRRHVVKEVYDEKEVI
jgi:hypothetical protein